MSLSGAACTLSGTDGLTGGVHHGKPDAGKGGDGDVQVDKDSGTPAMDAGMDGSMPEQDSGGSADTDSGSDTDSGQQVVDSGPSEPLACNDVRIELNYLVNSAWTSAASIYQEAPAKADAAYGAINDFRIVDLQGASSVHLTRSALAVIGLMEGVRTLDRLGCQNDDRAKQLSTVDDFFHEWLPDFTNRFQSAGDAGTDGGTADAGTPAPVGFPSEVHYDKTGAQTFNSNDVSVLASAQILVAMSKYVEDQQGDGYRIDTLPVALQVADMLAAKIDGTTKLVTEGTDASLEENTWVALAFRNLAGWAGMAGQSADGQPFAEKAAQIEDALQAFKVTGDTTNFARVRVSGAAGDNQGVLDITGFAPYFADVVSSAEPFAAQVSDYWTSGKAWNTALTHTTDGPLFYGTRLDVHETTDPVDEVRLYASASLALAKMEWGVYKVTRDSEYQMRAQKRLAFVRQKSGLWFGNPVRTEGKISGGIVEYKAEDTGHESPDTSRRYVDVSAAFIEAVALIDLQSDFSFRSTASAARKFQAEDWDNQQNTDIEPCEDVGSGSNLKELGEGDWTSYNNVSFDGIRSVALRQALNSTDGFLGTVEFRKDSAQGTLLTTCNTVKTGENVWQNWVTVNCAATTVTGTGVLFAVNHGLGCGAACATRLLANINWFELLPSQNIPAFPFFDQTGLLTTKSTAEGTNVLTQVNDGDFVEYQHVNLAGVTQFTVHAASATNPGQVEFHQDTKTGPLLGTCEMGRTGGADTWSDTYCPALSPSGSDATLFLVFKGASPNAVLPSVSWIKVQ